MNITHFGSQRPQSYRPTGSGALVSIPTFLSTQLPIGDIQPFGKKCAFNICVKCRIDGNVQRDRSGRN